MPTEFLSGIVPRLPFSRDNITLVDGAGQFSSGGTLNLFIQGRNRAGYTLVSSAIASVTYTATQAIQISFPPSARTEATDYHYYIVSHSPTGNPTDAIALFSWTNYEVDQITPRPLNPIVLSRDKHIELAPSVATPASLPTSIDLLGGMRRLVIGGVDQSAYYEYRELETKSPDGVTILQPHGIEKWVRTGSPNVGIIDSIYEGDGASTPINEIDPISLLAPPPYPADGTKGTPIKLIYRNSSSQTLPRGTAFLLQVQLEGAPASQLFDGKLILTPRGFVNLDNGTLDISDGIGGEMPDVGGDIPYKYGDRTVLFLHKDLPSGMAYFVEVAPYFSAAQFEGNLLNGANISINIAPATQSGESAYAIWQAIGNVVFNDAGRLRVVPGMGLNAKMLSGSALIERFVFPTKGDRDIYGIQPNLALQQITLDGNGSLFYRGMSEIPLTESLRALVSCESGYSLVSDWSNEVTIEGGFSVKLSYPCDSDGRGAIRSNYPTIANLETGFFNPPYVRLFVKRADETIFAVDALVTVLADNTQVVTVSSIDNLTPVDSLPWQTSDNFCLFDPPYVEVTRSSGNFSLDTYSVAAAYYFDGSAISAISHSTNDGCIYEAPGTFANLFAHLEDFSNPHGVTTFQIGAVDLYSTQDVYGSKLFRGGVTIAGSNRLQWSDGNGLPDLSLYRENSSFLRTDNNFGVGGRVVTNSLFEAYKVISDNENLLATYGVNHPYYAFRVATSGKIFWGNPSGQFLPDTFLYRDGVSSLKTDGDYTVGGNLTVVGANSATHIKNVAVDDSAKGSGKILKLNAQGDRLIYAEVGKEILTATRTYYVSPTGSDSNNGLAANSAFQTIQKAIDIAANLDLALFNVTVQLANGTYTLTNAILLKSFVGAGQIIIQGNATTPSSVLLTTGVGLSSTETEQGLISGRNINGTYKLRGLKLTSTATANNPAGIYLTSGSYLEYELIDFGTGLSIHTLVEDNSILKAVGNYSISGGAANHFFASVSSTIRVSSRTITLLNAPAFSDAFAAGKGASILTIAGNTFSGSATGKQYNVVENSVVSLSGGVLPGNSGGTFATGGVVV